jgi:hypothetical protein
MMEHWMPRRYSLASLLALATVMTVLGGGCRGAGIAPTKIQLAGQAEFVKDRGLLDHVTLIQFGMVGCRASAQGLEKMVALNRANRIEGLAYLRVESEPESEATRAYFAAKSPGFPVHYNAAIAACSIYDATVCPTYVLLDKSGRMRYRGQWPDEAELSQWVAALRDETVDPGPKVVMFSPSKLDAPSLLNDICLYDLDGGTKHLRDFMGPSGLLMVFVDTRHPAPHQSIKDMPSVVPVFAEHGVPSILVNLGESKTLIEAFYAKRHVVTPVLYDPGRATQHMWQIQKVPTVVMVDPAGAVVYKGQALWVDVGTAVEQHLGLPVASLRCPVNGTEFG